jgi:hypothetical protein
MTLSSALLHQLRYNVAKTLYDMKSLEKHPILKIINELDKKDAIDRYK